MPVNNENTDNQSEQTQSKFTSPRIIAFLVGIMLLGYIASYVVSFFSIISTGAFVLLIIYLGYFLYKKLFG